MVESIVIAVVKVLVFKEASVNIYQTRKQDSQVTPTIISRENFYQFNFFSGQTKKKHYNGFKVQDKKDGLLKL